MWNVLVFVLIGTGWNLSVDAGLQVTQNYYNEAWSGTEVSSVTWTAVLNALAERPLTDRVLFTNTTKLQYGQTYQQDPATDEWSPPQKSSDLVDNESVLRFTLGWLVDPYLSFRLLSQFRDEAHSLYLNPITWTEGTGLARTFVKTETAEMNGRLGVAFREVTDRASDAAAPVEGGLETVLWGTRVISERIRYEGELRVFKALYNSQADPADDRWKAPDVDWKHTLSVSLAKFVQLSVYAELVYDKDVIDRAQIRENLALGLTYKFF